MAKGKAAKRERINIKVGGTRFVRRRPDGTFKESDQLGPPIAADRRQKAKTKVKEIGLADWLPPQAAKTKFRSILAPVGKSRHRHR